MKKFKGTQGNWKIKKHPSIDTIHDVFSDIKDDFFKDGRFVARMQFAPDSEANAKLIANAPELLKACDEAFVMCDKMVMPTEEDLRVMANRLKTLINKTV